MQATTRSFPSFPLPVSLFARDTLALAAKALEAAWTLLGHHRETFVMSPELVRLKLAQGIVIAVATGTRDLQRLVKAALLHLEDATLQCLPPLEALPGEPNTKWKNAARLRYRAQELRGVAEILSDPETQQLVAGIALEYDRLARSAERVEEGLKTLRTASTVQVH